MSLVYKNLYQYVVEEINKRTTFGTTSKYNEQLVGGVSGFGQETGFRGDISTSEIVSAIQDLLSAALPPAVLTGLEVEQTDPISSSVIISAGTGTTGGKVFELTEDMVMNIPLDANTPVFYVNLFQNAILIERARSSEKLTIAKIVVPKPGVTELIQDTRDSSYNAYIVNYKEYKFYGHNDRFEEDTKDMLRDNIGDILAESIFGNITLSEQLKITNASGTLELNSDSLLMDDYLGNLLLRLDPTGLYFTNSSGVELAKFTPDGAYIGNIAITPSTVESRNFVTNVSGFQIRDDGNAEFNNVVLRGTLYSSYISENLYVNPGVTITGDMILNDDIWVNMNHKVGFNQDTNKNTYWTQNSSTSYLECWIDGAKRIEL